MSSDIATISDEVYLSILKFDVSDLIEIMEGFKEEIKYSGFNPRDLIADVSAKTSDQKILMQDMASLIVLFLNRGTNIEKMRKKMEKIGEAKVAKLIVHYKIKKESKDGRAITLARIAIAFAPQSMYLLRTTKPERPISRMGARSLCEGHDFPWALMSQLFMSMVPHYTKLDQDFLEQCMLANMAYCLFETQVINQEGRKEKWSKEKYLENLLKYASIGFRATHIPEEVKETFCRESLWQN